MNFTIFFFIIRYQLIFMLTSVVKNKLIYLKIIFLTLQCIYMIDLLKKSKIKKQAMYTTDNFFHKIKKNQITNCNYF